MITNTALVLIRVTAKMSRQASRWVGPVTASGVGGEHQEGQCGQDDQEGQGAPW